MYSSTYMKLSRSRSHFTHISFFQMYYYQCFWYTNEGFFLRFQPKDPVDPINLFTDDTSLVVNVSTVVWLYLACTCHTLTQYIHYIHTLYTLHITYSLHAFHINSGGNIHTKYLLMLLEKRMNVTRLMKKKKLYVSSSNLRN